MLSCFPNKASSINIQVIRAPKLRTHSNACLVNLAVRLNQDHLHKVHEMTLILKIQKMEERVYIIFLNRRYNDYVMVGTPFYQYDDAGPALLVIHIYINMVPQSTNVCCLFTDVVWCIIVVY